MNTILITWTVAAAVIFAGITVWALSGKRKAEFDEAARIPLDDEATDKLENGVR